MGLGGDERKHYFMDIGERIGQTANQDHVHARGELERHNDSIRTSQNVSSMFICHRRFYQSPNPNSSPSLTSFYLYSPTLTNALWFLIDPVKLALLVFDDIAFSEPQCDLLLCVFDAVGAVTDVAADIL